MPPCLCCLTLAQHVVRAAPPGAYSIVTPGPPLLSVLMLVTHTVRKIVPVLPRLRIVAVSIQRLKVRHACMTAIAIDMIDFNPILRVEEQPTGGAAPPLLF